ncbi:MAG: hypothetical protein KDC02_23290, partial [Flavobacteriales bacterium]|nr:hypothetical protein [Flavobacteriales bacterium]
MKVERFAAVHVVTRALSQGRVGHSGGFSVSRWRYNGMLERLIAWRTKYPKTRTPAYGPALLDMQLEGLCPFQVHLMLGDQLAHVDQGIAHP